VGGEGPTQKHPPTKRKGGGRKEELKLLAPRITHFRRQRHRKHSSRGDHSLTKDGKVKGIIGGPLA